MNRESVWYKKNSIRYTAGGLAIFLIFQFCNYITYSFLLKNYYASLANTLRPDMMSLMWLMYPGSFVFSFLMMYVFIKGFEDRGIPEGIRFGLLIGTMMCGMGALYQYIHYPLSLKLIIQWFACGLAEFILAGVAAGLIYKPLPEDDRDEEKDDMEIV